MTETKRRGGERQTGKEKQTAHTHTHRKTDRDTHRNRQETDKQRKTDTDRERNTEAEWGTDGDTETTIRRRTERQRGEGRQTGRRCGSVGWRGRRDVQRDTDGRTASQASCELTLSGGNAIVTTPVDAGL